MAEKRLPGGRGERLSLQGGVRNYGNIGIFPFLITVPGCK